MHHILKSTRLYAILVYNKKGVLHANTMFKSKLSDLFHVCVKHHNNLHPLMVFIMQCATGKTNHSVKLHRRVATRHVEVTNCPIRSIAFYLFYHCEVIKELEDPNIDFFDNSIWLIIKFVTDTCFAVIKQKQNVLYHTIGQTCKVLGVSLKSCMQTGCKLGLLKLEINKDNPDELQAGSNFRCGSRCDKYFFNCARA